MKRVKLVGTRADKAATFYWLMTNGPLYSDDKDIITMSDNLYKGLSRRKELKWKDID